MKRIKTEIIIESDPEKIWNVLTDLKGYADWCSAIAFGNGTAEKGGKVTLTTAAPDGSGKRYTGKGEIIESIPNKSLIWKGGMAGFLVGHHFWRLEKLDGERTKLVQGEDFYGLYPFFMGNRKIQSFKPFYENINAELKHYVEGELT